LTYHRIIYQKRNLNTMLMLSSPTSEANRSRTKSLRRILKLSIGKRREGAKQLFLTKWFILVKSVRGVLV